MEKRFDYLLLGGGTSCGYCAASIREIDKAASIGIIGAELEPPYDRPPFSKAFLKNDEMTPSDAHCKDKSFYPENGIELLLGNEAKGIELGEKSVVLQNGEKVGYDKLLYALGSEPQELNIPGGERAFLLRTYQDSEMIRERAKSATSVCVIGGGWLGPEVAASLLSRGLAVTIVEKMPRIWPNVASSKASNAVQTFLEKSGARVLTGVEVAEIEDGSVRLKNEDSIECDFVVAGVGHTPRLQLAKDSGLEVGEQGVRTDERLQSSNPNVWIAGDVAETDNPHLRRPYRAEHHLHAKETGAHAGKCMAGEISEFADVPYFFSDVGELSYIQRGYPEFAKESFVLGDLAEPIITEVFLFDDRTVAGVSDIREDYKQQDPISDLFESLIKSRANATNLVPKLSEQKLDVLELQSLL